MILRAGLYAAAATLILFVVIYGIVALFRCINVDSSSAWKRIEDLEVKSLRIVRVHQLWAAATAVVRLVRTLLILVIIARFVLKLIRVFFDSITEAVYSSPISSGNGRGRRIASCALFFSPLRW